LGRNASAKQACFDGDARRRTETARKTFGLIELAFAVSGWMKGNGHDEIPVCRSQSRHGAAQEQIGKEWLETESTIILVTMDNIQDGLAGDYSGTGGRKIQIEFTAIGAFKDSGDLTFIRRAATFTEWWIDKSNLATATGADKAFRGCCPAVAAKLADFRIAKREGGINPLFERVR